ncbi:MAG: hypothetical protein K6U03_10100 [Firmicutes bacterium]|nr:hypothetical protein [Bacillota bacterium]
MSIRPKKKLVVAFIIGALLLTIPFLMMVQVSAAVEYCEASYTSTAITIDGNLDSAWSGKVTNAITKIGYPLYSGTLMPLVAWPFYQYASCR